MSLRAIAWQSPLYLSKRDCHVAIASRKDMVVVRGFEGASYFPLICYLCHPLNDIK